MPAPRGPIPERSEHRRRRNKDGVEVVKGEAGEAWSGIELPAHWDEICHLYYQSVQDSGMAKFFEASDWITLYDALDELNLYKRGGTPVKVSEAAAKKAEDRGELVVEEIVDDVPFWFVIPKRGRSSQMRGAIDAIFARLGMTEGDRRRLRIELERPGNGDAPTTGVVNLDDYRKAL